MKKNRVTVSESPVIMPFDRLEIGDMFKYSNKSFDGMHKVVWIKTGSGVMKGPNAFCPESASSTEFRADDMCEIVNCITIERL